MYIDDLDFIINYLRTHTLLYPQHYKGQCLLNVSISKLFHHLHRLSMTRIVRGSSTWTDWLSTWWICGSNRQAGEIIALWDSLEEVDKQRVVYAARHQDRLLSGRFRTPKKPSNGAVPLQRGARFKRAVSCPPLFWLCFH